MSDQWTAKNEQQERLALIVQRLKEFSDAPADERQYTAYAKQANLVDDLKYMTGIVKRMKFYCKWVCYENAYHDNQDARR